MPPRRAPSTRQPKTLGPKLKHPITAVIYGPPKAGKTTLAANFPAVGFINVRENGIGDLQKWGHCKNAQVLANANSWPNLINALEKQIPDKIKTVVIDGLSGAQALAWEYSCQRDYNGSWDAFMDFFKGPRGPVRRLSQEFCDVLQDLYDDGKTIVTIAHLKIDTKGDIASAYDSYQPDLDKGFWSPIEQWVGLIGLLKRQARVSKKGVKTTAGDDGLFLTINSEPAITAGNRMGVEGPIDMGDSGKEGFKNLVEAFS